MKTKGQRERRRSEAAERRRVRRRQVKAQRRLSRAYRPGEGRWMVRVKDGAPTSRRPRWIPSWRSLRRKSDDEAKRMNAQLRDRMLEERGKNAKTSEEWKALRRLTVESSRKVWDTRMGPSPFGTRRVPQRRGGPVLMTTSVRSRRSTSLPNPPEWHERAAA